MLYPSGSEENHWLRSAENVPLTRVPPGLVTEIADSVPPAAQTSTGSVGETAAAPLAGWIPSRASGAATGRGGGAGWATLVVGAGVPAAVLVVVDPRHPAATSASAATATATARGRRADLRAGGPPGGHGPTGVPERRLPAPDTCVTVAPKSVTRPLLQDAGDSHIVACAREARRKRSDRHKLPAGRSGARRRWRHPGTDHNEGMAEFRIALAQVDTTVGDLAGNAAVVLDRTAEAVRAGAQLVAFPEMALTGYPPEDLVFRESFRAASVQALAELAVSLDRSGSGGVCVVVGYLDRNGGPRNAAALLHGGRVVARYFKHHLPNYGVFDEARYFVRGDRFVVVRIAGVDVALTICEDMWQDGGPFAVAGRARVGLVVNINGSPYERNKDRVRLPLGRRRAAEAGAALAYVNMVGAQDELVFDGDSFVLAADGTLVAHAPQYRESLLVADLELPAAGAPAGPAAGPPGLGMSIERQVLPTPAGGPVDGDRRPSLPLGQPALADRLPEHEEVWQALVTGTRDYARKNRFRSVVLGLSGGIDSAVTAAVAVDALGPDAVHGVSMPSGYSSEHSRTDAAEAARRLGCRYRVVPIAPIVDAYLGCLALTGLAEENLQSRVRGTTLMALSNQEGHLVLATGNKTELSVGYSTLYGDSVGGYAPLKDVPKTLVWELARWRNARADECGQIPPIPENSIIKPPSAELRPGQLDSDSLPPYDQLDAVLADYVDRDLGWADLVAAGHDPALVERVIRLVDAAEYKRRQYPPGPKISLKAFGRDRRLPISSRWTEMAPPGHPEPAGGPAGRSSRQPSSAAAAGSDRPPGDPVRSR